MGVDVTYMRDSGSSIPHFSSSRVSCRHDSGSRVRQGKVSNVLPKLSSSKYLNHSQTSSDTQACAMTFQQETDTPHRERH
eukprot:39295-Eustigmatos_ZCMA.PRE.1